MVAVAKAAFNFAYVGNVAQVWALPIAAQAKPRISVSDLLFIMNPFLLPADYTLDHARVAAIRPRKSKRAGATPTESHSPF
jgi:hypothetical protein